MVKIEPMRMLRAIENPVGYQLRADDDDQQISGRFKPRKFFEHADENDGGEAHEHHAEYSAGENDPKFRMALRAFGRYVLGAGKCGGAVS